MPSIFSGRHAENTINKWISCLWHLNDSTRFNKACPSHSLSLASIFTFTFAMSELGLLAGRVVPSQLSQGFSSLLALAASPTRDEYHYSAFPPRSRFVFPDYIIQQKSTFKTKSTDLEGHLLFGMIIARSANSHLGNIYCSLLQAADWKVNLM